MHLRRWLKESKTTQKKLGSLLTPPCEQALVWQWLTGMTRIDLSRALQIVTLTKGKVTAEELEKMHKSSARKTKKTEN